MSEQQPLFEIEDISHGWAYVRFRDPAGGEFPIVFSYVTDGMREFLTALMYVASRSVAGAVCRWATEPEYWLVTIQHRSHYRVRVTVRNEHDVASAGAEAPPGSFRTDVDLLVRDAVRAYQSIVDRHGEHGYRERWNLFPFPHAEFNWLSAWFARKKVKL